MPFEFSPRFKQAVDNDAETEKSNFWLTGYIEEENTLPVNQLSEFIGIVNSPPVEWILRE